MNDQRVHPYKDGLQKRAVYENFKTYEYLVPFNYENINVVRAYNQGDKHGMELNPINGYWPDPAQRPFDYIEVVEDEPIIRVEVFGSVCTPPGYIQLMFDPCEGFYRPDEYPGCVAPRMRIDNLWGMHLRVDQWVTKTKGVMRYNRDDPYAPAPEGLIPKGFDVKADSSEFPLVGFSCGVFTLPRSKSVRISGGGATPGWCDDNFTVDNHYSFRMIRTTICQVR
ncbi:MAG TPA: hypothetical protein PKE04_04325 [Clostridia bacterium]|nr:hypothetical protein [Clostridia bacterium]